jgi:hypothetical protein
LGVAILRTCLRYGRALRYTPRAIAQTMSLLWGNAAIANAKCSNVLNFVHLNYPCHARRVKHWHSYYATFVLMLKLKKEVQMKTTVSLCLVLLVAFTTNGQELKVESDRSLSADFSKYKTFYFASQADAWLDEGVYFLNDLEMKSIIRDAVKGELMGLGYEMQSNEPDLVVNFRVFEEPVTITGFEGYGTSYWGSERYRDVSDKASYDVEAGTLLVSIADRASGLIVWQGFASGLIDGDAFVKDESKIRQAVNMVFEDYNQRVGDYTKR